ncbi:MAG TPA: VOC family protein [Bryobacteraceae bacterium]|nr:VOC family protein [Bryobacteraceae bacterium]
MPVDIRGLAPLIYVFDMPASVHFYRDLLGFELVATSNPGPSFGWALLRLNGVELMLNTAYEDEDRPPAPEPSRVDAHGDTALYFGCPDVDLAYRQLRGLGLDVKEPANTYYGMRQLYVKDPDGFHLCLQWPVDGKWPYAER